MFGITGMTVQALAAIPPGPRLSVLLASMDLSSCGSVELFHVCAARARQVGYEQSRLLAEMLETVYAEKAEAVRRKAGLTADCSVVRERVAELDEFCADQLAFTLTWSRTTAHSHVLLAQDLVQRLPLVHKALTEGRIDLPRARAFSDGLADLDVDTARRVAAKLLEKAETWTPGRLRERIRYHALKADPDQAKKRYDRTVTDRRLYVQPYSDGTASLGGVNLPPHLAVAAYNRIDRLARAAKHAGDPRTLQQLRADAYLDLLCGKPFRLTPSLDEHTAHADQAARNIGLVEDDPDDLATPTPPHTVRTRPGTPQTTTPDAASANTVRATGTAQGGEYGEGSTPDNGQPDAASDLPPIGSAIFDTHPPDHAGPTVKSPPETSNAVPEGVPVASDDPRMCVCGGIQPAPRRGFVDLHLKLSTLMCLNEDPGIIPGWGPVIADIARQVAHDQETNPAWKFSLTDDEGHLLHNGPVRRRPTATEKAFVKARDKTCRAPGCRQPAMSCDDDHRDEWANGGPSHRDNLCVLCRHHHRLRHDRGFVIHNICAGTAMWEAPNGMFYIVLPDATLLPVEDHEPGPPRGYVDDAFDNPPLEDAYGRS